MRVRIFTDTTAEGELYTLAEIMYKLRYYSELWDKHYGAANRKAKKFWEAKADEWISQHVKQEG